MLRPDDHPDEAMRILELHGLGILDTAPEERFDRITRLAMRLFDVKFALVSLVDAKRQWFKSNQGLSVCETARDISFCGHAILEDQALVVEDAHLDVRFADNPLVVGPPGLRFYAGIPLLGPAGYPLGTLCVIDTKPRRFSPSDVASLRDLGDLIEGELGATSLAASRRAALLSQARMTAVIDNIMDGIITTDCEGNIETINRAASRIFDYDAAAVIGQNIQALMPETYHREGSDLRAFIADDIDKFIGTVREVNGRQRDGTQFPMELSVSEISCPGYRGFAGIFRDITERRRHDQELLVAKHNAESANRAKSDFLANMSHEIRTPLHAMLGLTYLLSTTTLSDDQHSYLKMIESSGQSLLAIVNDILDFSKIEAGQMMLTPTITLLSDLLQPLAAMMSVSAGDKDLELLIGVDPAVPTAYLCDPLRMHQVLLNLLSNAIKFTQVGEVSLLIDCIERRAQSAVLRFRVRDSGIGISEEQQCRLFQAFTQADSSTTRRFGGTGLGLSISHRLATMMGGEITINSQFGHGSEFCFSLELPVAPLGQASSTASASVSAHGSGLRVLLVSDYAASIRYVGEMIEASGWKMMQSVSAEQALDFIHAAAQKDSHYEVVLVDGNSDTTGTVTLLREIQALRCDAQIPLIVCMTNVFGRRLLEQAGAVGIDAFLTKPVISATLRKAVDEARTCHDLGAKAALPSTQQKMQHRIDARILLVEDNVLNQIVASSILRRAGIDIDIANNGQQAVEMLREKPLHYQIVLMDVQMPVMDGIQATVAIRQCLGLDVPILAMTAGVLDTERSQCLDAGMTDIIPKPFDVNLVFAMLKHYLPTTAASVATAVESQAIGSALDGVFDVDYLFVVDDPATHVTTIDLIETILIAVANDFETADCARIAGDYSAACRLLHEMRGTLGSLGASRFAQATRAAESALKAEETDKFDSLFEIVSQELVACRHAGVAWLASRRAQL